MANSPSKAVLVAAAVMGIGAMVVLNSMNKTPKTEEQQEQDQEKAQQEQAQKAASKPGAPKVIVATPQPYPGDDSVKANGGDSGKASALVGLGEDKVVGTSPSGPEVNIRYSWTPAVQNDPKKVYDAVAAVKRAVPNARVHVIKTDEHPGAPDGVFIGNKQIAPAAADGSIAVSADAVKAAVGSKSK